LLVERVESDANHRDATATPTAPHAATSPRKKRSPPKRSLGGEKPARKTDLAEALVGTRPGLNSAQIGDLIGQGRAAADSTLRQVEAVRGTIERHHDDYRWYPVVRSDQPADTGAQ